MPARAVFPGSFDPLTIAHLAIADAVREQLAVSEVDLVISRVALTKEHIDTPVDHRLDVIRSFRAGRPWLAAKPTDARLLADIADGYDVLVIGADKWHQLLDVGFYDGSAAARDAALARLPQLAIAPRAGADVPARLPDGGRPHLLRVPKTHRHVSSTAVRRGRIDWRAAGDG